MPPAGGNSKFRSGDDARDENVTEEMEGREERGIVPPNARALPGIEEGQLEEERKREQLDEESFRRRQRTGEEGESAAAAPLSEISAAAPVTLSHLRPWTTLESAESHISAPQPAYATVIPAESRLSEFATKLYTVSYLIFFSIFGALARIGLEALTFYPGAPVTTGVLWANVGGCLLMGFFAEDRQLFREEWGKQDSEKESASPEEALKKHKAVKKTIPLYVGLTTGFCGSFTSFSTFISDAFLALSNDLPNPDTPMIAPRNGGYSFMAVVAVILYTVSLSLSALVFGAYLAVFLDRFTPNFPFLFLRKFFDRFMVFLAFGCWLGGVFLAIWPPDRHAGINENWRGRAVFAVVFAPLGCLLRYYVSLFLNARVPSFPLGTFAVNMFGTMILGMCFDLKHATSIVASTTTTGAASLSRLTGCQVLNGVMDGFCGCTTTVSTWVAELHSLELRHAYRYGIMSVALGLALLVVILGSMRWTVGFGVPVC